MFFLRLLSRLPLPILYLFADFLVLLAYRIVGYRKKVVTQNLRRSFPDKSDKEIEHITKGFYHNLAYVVVEIVKAVTISRKEMQQRVSIKNPEVLQGYIDDGKPVLVLASHQCNWEWVLLGAGAHFNFPMDAVYKPLTENFSEQLMLGIRSKFGGKPIPSNQTVREILKRRSVVRAFGMVADQVPVKEEKKHWVTFLGQETPFFIGAEKIAQLTKYPVLFIRVHRPKRGYYELEFVNISEPPYNKESFDIVEKYAAECERLIRDYPSDWLWSHKRWKYTREQAGD
ncbi:lysophospholipid acyltransferase family protein [Limibacter armeniacum]|uniref:lysophospholipid acyltransferase family protein n=1 Tax=Limibacter armeniacum TaxID=466084 RepID=UPI002FE66A7D